MKSKARSSITFTDEKRCESRGMTQDNRMRYKEKQSNPILQGAGPVEDHDRDFSFCSKVLGPGGF